MGKPLQQRRKEDEKEEGIGRVLVVLLSQKGLSVEPPPPPALIPSQPRARQQLPRMAGREGSCLEHTFAKETQLL